MNHSKDKLAANLSSKQRTLPSILADFIIADIFLLKLITVRNF